MRIIFLGCTKFSKQILESISDIESIEIVGIFAIPQKFKISYSAEPVTNTNYADLRPFAETLNIPFFEIDSVPGQRITDHTKFIAEAKVDVILVMGWYYMVPAKIRELAKYGAWGIHASLLPKYAGGAPLVWAIINGEKETGVSLFQLSDGVDDGDIIAQEKIDIAPEDTIKEVYAKATKASSGILQTVLGGTRDWCFTPQNKDEIEVWPQRNPKDGEINWGWDPERIHNFIRAQSKPYPGAWTNINGKKVTIWDAKIEMT